MRSHNGAARTLLILSTAALTACTGSPDGTVRAMTPTFSAQAATSPTPSPRPAPGVDLPASEIPWAKVGQGWILATWSPTTGPAHGQAPPDDPPAAAPVTLYLINPEGERFPITTMAVVPPTGPGDPGHTPSLAAWSGDGRRALFEDHDSGSPGPERTTLTEVDLTSGAKRSLTVNTRGAEAAYSQPTGESILLSTFVDYERGSTLDRIDLSGAHQFTFPTDRLGAAGRYNGAYLQTPDGGQLVLGAAHGLVVMGSDGVVVRRLSVPGPLTNCQPVRWWTSEVILAECDHGRQDPGRPPDFSSQLWQIPLHDQAPTALTAINTDQEDSGFGGDLGDENAWQLPGGTFLQSAGGCSTFFLSRLTADKHTTPVSVPGVDTRDSVIVVGSSVDTLVLQASMACGPGVSLLTYDPVANTSTVVLGPPINGGRVQQAIMYRGLASA